MEKNLLVYFLEIEQLSVQMLQAAHGANWDQIDRLEIQCSLMFSEMQGVASCHQLSKTELWEKNRIMRRILQNDAQVRDLMEPWLDEVEISQHWVKRLTH